MKRLRKYAREFAGPCIYLSSTITGIPECGSKDFLYDKRQWCAACLTMDKVYRLLQRFGRDMLAVVSREGGDRAVDTLLENHPDLGLTETP